MRFIQLDGAPKYVAYLDTGPHFGTITCVIPFQGSVLTLAFMYGRESFDSPFNAKVVISSATFPEQDTETVEIDTRGVYLWRGVYYAGAFAAKKALDGIPAFESIEAVELAKEWIQTAHDRAYSGK